MDLNTGFLAAKSPSIAAAAASPGSSAFSLGLPYASKFIPSIGSVQRALVLNWRSQVPGDAAGWQGAGSREQGAGGLGSRKGVELGGSNRHQTAHLDFVEAPRGCHIRP
eukprot:gene12327-biopygen18471